MSFKVGNECVLIYGLDRREICSLLSVFGFVLIFE